MYIANNHGVSVIHVACKINDCGMEIVLDVISYIP